jgi:hypothetical protein
MKRALAPIPEMTVIPAQPVAVTPGVIGPTPPGAFLVYGPDPRCEGRGFVIPDLMLCTAMRDKAAEYVTGEVQSGRVRPGPGFTACTWPSDPAWRNCIEFAVKRAMPEIRFGVSPVWVIGHIGGVPYEGPAAGVAYQTFIRVSLADTSRIMRLCAWETANCLLAYLFDLPTYGDGPVTAAATDYAARACGVA